jgi:DnaA-homolog protein
VTEFSPQIPFELFEAEAPSFENFLVGHNAELVTRLYALSHEEQLHATIALWSGPRCGKTHLLKAVINEIGPQSNRFLFLSAGNAFPESPFIDASGVIIDDADRLSDVEQAWAFNAFNHVVSSGGVFLTSGSASPLRWPIRDDLRTRLASGVTYEVLPVPQNELAVLLAEHAQKRGVSISKEVLTYIMDHSTRDAAHLCQTISGIDRLSLSLKRAITVPLARTYLAQQAAAATKKEPPA